MVTWVGGVVVMSGVWIIMFGQNRRERDEERMHRSINHVVDQDGILEIEVEMPDSQCIDTHNPLYVIEGDESDDEGAFDGLESTSSHALKGDTRGNARSGRINHVSATQ